MGRLRVSYHENALDKKVAATAFIYGLTLLTWNMDDFAGAGVKILNPCV